MKRLSAFLLSLLLLISLVGCGNNTPPVSDVSDYTSAVTTASTTVDAQAGATPQASEELAGGNTTKNGGGGTQAGNKTTTGVGSTPTTAATAPNTATAEQQLVDKAFALTGNATLQATLSGTITNVKEDYSAQYNNASFTIQVKGSDGKAKDLYCYRCQPTGSDKTVVVGQTVTVSGTIKNYNGTIEFEKGSYTVTGGAVGYIIPTMATANVSVTEDGIYDSVQEVGLYTHLYGKLPKNYVRKNQYNDERDLCVGGDRFGNYERLLPFGQTYYECDIDTLGRTSRGAKRLVWTTSGIVYYTSDHYQSFVQLYGAR